MEFKEAPKPLKKQPKIVIIGAGISGIAAGEYLTRMGFSDVKILEAANRTGGRIWSVNVDENGHKAEMGANWIHGIERNPIYQIADENHLLALRHGQRSLRTRDIFLTEDGQVLNSKTVKEVDLVYGLLIQQCEEFFQCNIPTPEENDSVGAYLDREFSEKLERYQNGDRKLRENIFRQRLCLESCISGCDNLYEVSLGEFGGYEELPGVHYTIPPGFETVLDILKKNIPKQDILLNHPVRCLHWNVDKDMVDDNEEQYEVCVECENGEKFYANHVIVTVSLGVLKAACNRMFDPSLPVDKLHAIQSLGFGVVDKVILQFDEPVVDQDVHRIQLLWDTDREKTEKFNLQHDWYKKMYSFEVVHENFLIAWLSGKEALYMESMSDEQIGRQCQECLKKFLKKDIPLPSHVIRTRWGNDVNTRGSYSFIQVGSVVADIDILREPLRHPKTDKPLVQFAGEATHPTFYSTTHGALLTGYREAQLIKNLYTE